jgi:hypothetical protein
VRGKLLAGVKPLRGPQGQCDSAERSGYAHDLRFATAPKDPARGVPFLRKADQKFIAKLKQLERRGHPKLNTRIGIHGIQLKRYLIDKKKTMNPTRYLNPMKDSDPAKAIAKRELARMEQAGYGAVLPGQALKKKIMRQLKGSTAYGNKKYVKQVKKDKLKRYGREKGGAYLGREDISGWIQREKQLGLKIPKKMRKILPGMMNIRVPPKILAKMTVKHVIPEFIRRIAKRVGMRPRMMGKGVKAGLVMDIEKMFKTQQGGALLATLAALAPLGISAATTLTPLAIKLGKKVVPKIVKAFKKGKVKGFFKKIFGRGVNKLDPRYLFGMAMMPIFKLVWKMIVRDMKSRNPELANRGWFGAGVSLAGGALKKLKTFIGKVGKKFINSMSKVIKVGRKAIPVAQKGLKYAQSGLEFAKKNIKSPKDVAQLIVNKGIPGLLEMIRKRTGLKNRQLGSGVKRKLTAELARRLRYNPKGGAIGIGTLLSLAAGAAPIAIPLLTKAAKFLVPKIISLFKRKGKKGRGINYKRIPGKIKKVMNMSMVDMLQKALGYIKKKGKMAGKGLKSFFKKISKPFVSAFKMVMDPEFQKGFVKGFKMPFEAVGKVAGPIAKELGPIAIKEGLPLILKMLAKSG